MLKDFVSLLFPRTCLISHKPLAKGEEYIATEEALNLPTFDITEKNVALESRIYSFAPVAEAWAYYKFSKRGKVQKLLHAIKYSDCPELGELTGKWFGQLLKENINLKDIDLIIPVPLHRRKKRTRGYNQCDHIAQGLSQVLGIPWSDHTLVKTKNTQSQTKKSRIERYYNSYLSYSISSQVPINNLHVLLVDDVVTTGATVGSCANILLENGCRAVSVAALATPE